MKINYPLSKDYEKLYDICINNKAIIVCFIDCYKTRDICKNLISENGRINIGARGISYIYAINKDDFIEQCIDRNLGFIDYKYLTLNGIESELRGNKITSLSISKDVVTVDAVLKILEKWIKENMNGSM